MALKVGIISSYKTRCDIASFTDTLETLLDEDFSLEVLALDQFLLRHRHPRVAKMGDKAIGAIGRRLKEFDVIHLQWAPRLLGPDKRHWVRRTRVLFRHMIKAKKRVIITAHTVVLLPAVGLHPIYFVGRLAARTYASTTHRLLRQLDRAIDLTLVAHSTRDRAYYKNVVGLSWVVDHPLIHMRKGWPERVREGAADYRQKLDRRVGTGKKLIGTFGSLMDYRGIEVAIRAMRYLPEDFVLLIYGEVHGDDIKPWQKINLYVSKLLKESLGDPSELRKSLLATPARTQQGAAAAMMDMIQSNLRKEMALRNRSITNRVFFFAAPDDFELALAVRSVDACVFPCLETGENASGPLAQATELQAKVALSRTRTFSDLEFYFPRWFHFFEIGNALELAQLLEELVARDELAPELSFDQTSLKAFYSALYQGERVMPTASAT